MLLWGACSLRAGVSSPDYQRATRPKAAKLFRFAAVLNLVMALGWLGSVAALAGDGPQDALDPEVLTTLLAASRFGQAWLVHLGLAAVLMLVSLTDRPRWTFALTGLNLASLGLVGHAVLPSGGLGVVHQGLSALHLLASGFWVGGLVVILPLLSARAMTDDALPLLRRFSWWGHVAVATVLASGAAKSVLILSMRSETEPAISYLTMLALKIAVVGLMMGLALVNRYRFVPGLASEDRVQMLRNLKRGTLAEIVLAALVLGLVSIFATWSPFSTG